MGNKRDPELSRNVLAVFRSSRTAVVNPGIPVIRSFSPFFPRRSSKRRSSQLVSSPFLPSTDGRRRAARHVCVEPGRWGARSCRRLDERKQPAVGAYRGRWHGLRMRNFLRPDGFFNLDRQRGKRVWRGGGSRSGTRPKRSGDDREQSWWGVARARAAAI